MRCKKVSRQRKAQQSKAKQYTGTGQRMQAHHFVELENGLALVSQVDVGDGNLPALFTLADGRPHGPANDLVAEAHAHDSDAAGVDGLLCILHQLQDPGVVVKRCVTRPGYQDGIDLVQRRVRLQVLDNVVRRDGGHVGERPRRIQGLCGRRQQRSEDASIAAVLCVGLGLRRVGLEEQQPERLRCERAGCGPGPGDGIGRHFAAGQDSMRWRHGDESRGGGETLLSVHCTAGGMKNLGDADATNQPRNCLMLREASSGNGSRETRGGVWARSFEPLSRKFMLLVLLLAEAVGGM